ncbi:MAG: hypothetical protein AABY67_02925, partial [Nitrospirota bacterium]
MANTRALLAAEVAGERIVDRERRQGRIAGAFFVERVRFTGRADRIETVGQDEVRSHAGVEDGD